MGMPWNHWNEGSNPNRNSMGPSRTRRLSSRIDEARHTQAIVDVSNFGQPRTTKVERKNETMHINTGRVCLHRALDMVRNLAGVDRRRE